MPHFRSSRLNALLDRAAVALKAQWLMLSNAWFATVASASSAVLGFLFWSLCSRSFSAENVGLASATISALNLVALLAELGLATLLLGHVANDGKIRRGMISAAVLIGIASATLAAVLGLQLVFGFNLQTGAVVAGHLPSLIFTAGVVIAAVALIVDGALFGLLRTILHMYRELVFAICKIVLLLGLIYFVSPENPSTGILTVWVVSGFLALAFLALLVKQRGARITHRPEMTSIVALFPTSLKYHFLNIAASASAIAMPLLVAEVVSPEVNAVFFLAWMMVHVALLATDSLATAVFAIEKFDANGRANRVGFALLASTLVCLGGTLAYVLLVEHVLAILNPTYPQIAGPSLKYLGLGMLAWSVKALFMAVMRLEGRMTYATVVFAVGGVAELIAAAVGGALYGLGGLVGALLIGLYAQAIVMLPPILRAANVPSLLGSWLHGLVRPLPLPASKRVTPGDVD